ncbi:hypothetical protein [Desulfatitalea alkaliphila]|uniref:Uncharacterized protein n=1 Tax=Desulfatitalea alkaliphila TaxID=2929485 RepID=A0AA41UPI7_9BACT|nr:hypothetical protein [Desulfatitalea alkaliphila]MCJ8500518.1 hypothetical protein [Desulfatitalea alkaliphila]
MGKDSLIKSTTAKSGAKKKKTTSKKTTAKKSAPAKSKTKKSAAAAGKKTTKAAAKKTTAKTTVKDLLFKQFDSRFTPAAGGPPTADRSAMSAPPLITADDPAEVQRLRGLLDRRFSMAEIKAAAKEPPPVEKKPAAPEPDVPEPPVTASTEVPAGEQETAPPDPPEAAKPVEQPAAPIATPAPPEAKAPVSEAGSAEDPPPVAEEVSAQTPTPVPEPPAATSAAAASVPTAPAEEPPKPAVATAPAAEQVYQSMEEPAVQSRNMSSGAPPAADESTSDPVMRAMKIGIAALCVVVLFILWASFANSKRYYISEDRHGMTILQGAFSPTGKRVLAVLPGRQPADPVQAVYSRKEVFPLIFQFHLDQADAKLAETGLPDFDTIQTRLDLADAFALDKGMRASVTQRRNHLQRTQLIHQAHVEISKDTLPAMSTALQQLRQAQRLAADPVQLEAINQMITLVNERRAGLQARIAAETEEETGTR